MTTPNWIRNFCTLSDRKYLLQGLALYESLLKVIGKGFKLYYLCLDEETYLKLVDMKLSYLIPINLKDLEKEDRELREFKSNPNSKWGDQYTQYCWALAPYFCDYLINKKSVTDILYCDSDIYFFSNFHLIEEEVGKSSIGIVKHRISQGECKKPGIYNVGIVYFRGDEAGKSCSAFWKYLLFNPENEYSVEYGTCGDQKYLELFPQKYTESICIIDKLVGHGAPWNYKYQNFETPAKVVYENRIQSLVFNHFARFRMIDDEIGFYCGYNGREWIKKIKSAYLKQYYYHYYQVIMRIKNKYLL